MTALAISNAVLWVVVIGLCIALLAVVRQLGVLHERIAPAGALMLAKGLKVGEPAPRITVQDLESRSLTLGAARADSARHFAGVRVADLPGVQGLAAGVEIEPHSGAGLARHRSGKRRRERRAAGVRRGSPARQFSLRRFRAARHCLPGQPTAVRGADRRAGRAAGARYRQFARTSGKPVRGQAARASHRSRIISKRQRNIRPRERKRL